MTNTQLFIALLASFLSVAAGQIATLKWYVDARFSAIDSRFAAIERSMDSRFTAVDNQLKFLVDHAVSHAERIAALEARRPQ